MIECDNCKKLQEKIDRIHNALKMWKVEPIVADWGGMCLFCGTTDSDEGGYIHDRCSC